MLEYEHNFEGMIMTTATIVLNRQSGLYEARLGDVVFMESGNKNYIKWYISSGRSAAARKLGVTNCIITTDMSKYTDKMREAIIAKKPTALSGLGEFEVISNAGVQTDEINDFSVTEIPFDINERFEFVSDFVKMVGTRKNASALIVGSGGLGKSYTTLETLTEKCGLRQVDATMENYSDYDAGFAANAAVEKEQADTFLVVRGYTTPKGLYRTLYENRNRVIVFDDCDDIFTNTTSMELLKSALDSYERRVITWNSIASFGDDLPRSFEFMGGVIFISNKSLDKMPQPLISRSLVADVSMTRAETLERLRVIAAKEKFMPEYTDSAKIQAIDFIAQHVDNPLIPAINIRTLMMVVKLVGTNNWERAALYLLVNSR